MPLDFARARQHLRNFDLPTLFTQELGWDWHPNPSFPVQVEGRSFTFTPVAQKRGFQVFVCDPLPNGSIPDYPTRRKIERQITKCAHEHLIIFTDGARATQIWQWVKRQPGKPTACREHQFRTTQDGESLCQKLNNLAVSLDEEEGLTLPDVHIHVRAAFDVERVTKRFYDRFKAEHAAFLKFLNGIPDEGLQRQYACIMLSRLMFIYFIQQKGFLDGNPDYLRARLAESKSRGKNRFYRDFLCPLFFEGFARKERRPAVNQLLGRVPYLNGGIFQRHQIEEEHDKAIDPPDAAFDRILDFFKEWHWHLDERPLRDDREINPSVLGYIFEKYINAIQPGEQKAKGAYYTQEDITRYISQNTVIPYLFDAAKPECRIAFEGEQCVWRLLQSDPARYIYEPVRRGVIAADGAVIPESALPDFVQKGMHDPKARMFDKSYNLTQAVIPDPEGKNLALPTETWREYIERRSRCLDLRRKLAAAEVRDINDLITLNLDIRQFAQDVIENCEGPETLRAFWHAIVGRVPGKSNERFEQGIAVLDPACGSGAFLFAALNILEPLYEACLDRMESFVADLDRSGEKHRPEKFSDFRSTLVQVAEHPNRRYFIFRSIVVNNLYGLDIMEEAVEICKLRLFLKLVAQVDRDESKPNFGIEPLPDIDFNIRAGNSLVGYTSYEQVRRRAGGKLDLGGAMKRIDEMVQDVDRLFASFRQQQTKLGGQVTATDKDALRLKLKTLDDELNGYLAHEHEVDPNQPDVYRQWLRSHKPFHWFVEFVGPMKSGGFTVITGNPPYLELRDVEYEPKGFASFGTKAIHAMFVERGASLLHPDGCMSMIVPMSLVSTQRMGVVQAGLEKRRNCWYANYSWRPGKLFDTVNRALTIFAVTPSKQGLTWATGYQKWNSDNRDPLMTLVHYVAVDRDRPAFWVPKLACEIERGLLQKCLRVKTRLADFMGSTEHKVFYRTDGGLYWKVFTDFAPAFRSKGKTGHSTRETWVTLRSRDMVRPAIAYLSSAMFWWWYTVTSNCRHLNPYDVLNFPVPASAIDDGVLAALGDSYLVDLQENSTMLVRQQKQTGRTETQCFKIQKSKPIIDQIDRVLAGHYGFTDEELDFIINYDIKYRMGLDTEADGEGDEG